MKRSWSAFNIASVLLGFAFLYGPVVILVIYSFNASRLVTVWGGFSTQWYAALWNNTQLLQSAWVTVRVGVLSATVATVLGTLAAMALVRFARFRGRLLFSGFVYAPLVMPEVITGLSLLLLFVAVVVQSRLVSVDRSLEEAAQDLGCPPAKTFFVITLPVIWTAVASGWMLAFTLSIDDLVISSFTTGPGATTLPMRIYSQVRLGVTPEINAVCTILIALVSVGVVISGILTKRQLVRRERDERMAAAGVLI